jgi:formamidopyrimidine-DNA glycosylase
MPELPEVETIRVQLAKKIIGKIIFGQKIVGLRRRAKILIIDLANGQSLIFHLKMTGQLIYNGKPSPYTRKVFNFTDGSKLIFNDVRKFGWWKKAKNVTDLENQFGPEPLLISLLDFQSLFSRKSRTKIKSFLMNQKVIAGIGNIYSDEILYAAKINPVRQANSLSAAEIRLVFQQMKRILALAIRLKGSSTRDYLDAYGEKGSFAKLHKVYGREGQKCSRCHGIIKRIKIGGRSAHFCPNCQK